MNSDRTGTSPPTPPHPRHRRRHHHTTTETAKCHECDHGDEGDRGGDEHAEQQQTTATITLLEGRRHYFEGQRTAWPCQCRGFGTKFLGGSNFVSATQLMQQPQQQMPFSRCKHCSSFSPFEAALLEKVRRMIREELRRFGSDRTGIVDYALESSGGSMLSTRCTVQYNERSRVHKLFGLPTLVHRLFTKNCYTGQNIATCIMGFVNVSMTVISVYMVERSGRRTLHLVGLLGTCVTTALLAASMHISEDALGKNVFFFLFHPAADSAVHPVCIQIFAGDKEQNVGASAGGDGPFAWQNTRLGERTNGQQINECDYRVRSLYFI